jgi:beta-glucanase (GH16 family)
MKDSALRSSVAFFGCVLQVCTLQRGSGSNSSPIDAGRAGSDDASSATPDGATGMASDGATSDVPSTDATLALDAGGSGAAADSGIPGWVLTWSDEFNGADGSPVDPNKWSHEVGGGGWGNGERQFYTDGTLNAVQQGGNLVITATTSGASQYKCWYGACQYTSARLNTRGKFEQQYGRIEARIQLPFGQGIWPAFWMLGGNIGQVGWPACGEIDIMENIGKEPSIQHGSLHMTGANPTGAITLPNGSRLADAFHTFSIEWDPGAIRFYMDGQLYETQTPAGLPRGGVWAFDRPLFILLNVAVGGQWPGNPDPTTMLPQTMKVDWVRVYQRATGGG